MKPFLGEREAMGPPRGTRIGPPMIEKASTHTPPHLVGVVNDNMPTTRPEQARQDAPNTLTMTQKCVPVIRAAPVMPTMIQSLRSAIGEGHVTQRMTALFRVGLARHIVLAIQTTRPNPIDALQNMRPWAAVMGEMTRQAALSNQGRNAPQGVGLCPGILP
ncbi:hypothetical protein CGCSCA1_v014484 [Colletotrichum siamense]|nr:hypothetical protein CGCSCA1_v014484 [Colletotrichum siamense]